MEHYISVTIKPPCDGTCTQGSLYSLLVMVNDARVTIKPSCDGKMYSKDTIKPPSGGTYTQGTL